MMVSSYTANLAASLTAENMVSPINKPKVILRLKERERERETERQRERERERSRKSRERRRKLVIYRY